MSSKSPITLEQLNAATRAEFTALLDGIYEHSPWIAEAAWDTRPFASLAALRNALVRATGVNCRSIKELGAFWAIINEPPPGSSRR